MMFRRAMRRFLCDPGRVAAQADGILSDLVYGWGNQGWSGQPEFLLSCIEAALATNSPILECGSGLTTIILGALAKQTGNSVWTLEHIPSWGERVQHCLDQFDIRSVHLCVSPLADYGEYEWYAPPFASMPDRFGLVVCDGPPSQTRGGRYGLVPTMRGRFGKNCSILLDDAEREAEQRIVSRWENELPCAFIRVGTAKPFFSGLVGDQTDPAR